MTVDPVLSLLIGALGAALLGLIGAAIQARREHTRWVRQRRFEAYDSVIKLAERVRSMGDGAERPADAEYFERLFEALGSVRLVGPTGVVEGARAFGEAATNYASLGASKDAESGAQRREALERLSNARKSLVELMRKELGMKG